MYIIFYKLYSFESDNSILNISDIVRFASEENLTISKILRILSFMTYFENKKIN